MVPSCLSLPLQPIEDTSCTEPDLGGKAARLLPDSHLLMSVLQDLSLSDQNRVEDTTLDHSQK